MSENYVDNTTSYSFDVIDSTVDVALPDIINTSLDSLKVGLESVTADQLQKWLELSGRRHDLRGGGVLAATSLTNLTPKQIRNVLAATQATRDQRPGAIGDPYEFVLAPITGANPLGIKKPILFPLPPEKFMVQREQQARTFIAINGQEYSLPGPQTLASISLEGMFPSWSGRRKPNFLPGYVDRDNYLKPHDLGLLFERVMKKGQPLQLTIGPGKNATALKTSGGLIGVMYVTIVSFEYGEAFGHPGDYVFSMGLKEWRPIFPNASIARVPQPATPLTRLPATTTSNPPATQPQAISTPVGVTTPPSPGRPQPEPAPPLKAQSPATRPDVPTYIVKQGDTLFDIAANILGTGTRMTELYALNKKTIDDECRRRGSSTYPRGWHIWPGTRLVIPPKGQRDGTA
jgi:nucleoid-associated protein YgaU